MRFREFERHIRRTAKKRGIEIKLFYKFDARRRNSEWYGGDVFVIEKDGYTVTVSAVGDVCAELYKSASETTDDTLLAYVKDKCNGGWFGHEMSPYLKTDAALDKAMKEGRLNFLYSNWFEFFVRLPDGRYLDEVRDDVEYDIADAIMYAMDYFDELIKRGKA